MMNMSIGAPPGIGTEITTAVDRSSFLLIGAPKAGTTTIYHYLRRQFGLFMCEPKELRFISDDLVDGTGLGLVPLLATFCNGI